MYKTTFVYNNKEIRHIDKEFEAYHCFYYGDGRCATSLTMIFVLFNLNKIYRSTTRTDYKQSTFMKGSVYFL